MNRLTLMCLAFGGFLEGCTSPQQPQPHLIEDTVPSGSSQVTVRSSPGLSMVGSRIAMHRTRDLRTLFRSPDEIERLERIGVCSIEPVVAMTKRHEIFVGARLPLDSVIRSVFGHDYDGQIKVVSRNMIVQTSIVD